MVLERMVNSERESMKVKNGTESSTSQIEEATIPDLPIKSKHKVRTSLFEIPHDKMCNPTSFVTSSKESEATASSMGVVRFIRNFSIDSRIEASGR